MPPQTRYRAYNADAKSGPMVVRYSAQGQSNLHPRDKYSQGSSDVPSTHAYPHQPNAKVGVCDPVPRPLQKRDLLEELDYEVDTNNTTPRRSLWEELFADTAPKHDLLEEPYTYDSHVPLNYLLEKYVHRGDMNNTEIPPKPPPSTSKSTIRPQAPQLLRTSSADRELQLFRKLDDYKLETRFYDEYLVHRTYKWELSTRVWEESTWKRVKHIGTGAFGEVWLEEGVGGELRAVKELRRRSAAKADFAQELLALVKLREASALG